MHDASPLLGFLVGLLSILSPCVLPLVPIVLSSASGRHRLGPFALGAGLAISFTAVGLFIALVGFSLGLDADLFRRIGGGIMVGLGLMLMTPRLQAALATVAAPLGNWANSQTAGLGDRGVSGQFAIGLLLGLVWTSCVGPTLGAAALLASRGEAHAVVAVTMISFAIGASAALIAVGSAWRSLSQASRLRVRSTASGGKTLLAIFLIALGGLAMTGLDRFVEGFLIDLSPDWLTRLTTSL